MCNTNIPTIFNVLKVAEDLKLVSCQKEIWSLENKGKKHITKYAEEKKEQTLDSTPYVRQHKY